MITGATTFLIGAFISVLIFSKPVAIIVLLFLTLGDTIAFLVGSSVGRLRIFKEKTVEGALSFLLVACLIVYLFPIVNLRVGLIGAFIGCGVELIPKVDDNLVIPIVTGAIMEFML
jgi:dolichol kinase